MTARSMDRTGWWTRAVLTALAGGAVGLAGWSLRGFSEVVATVVLVLGLVLVTVALAFLGLWVRDLSRQARDGD